MKNIEQQTEEEVLNLALDYLTAPEWHLSGDDEANTRNTSSTFRLLDKHLPALQAGTYDISIRQTVTGEGITTGNVFSTTQQIKVVGTPYALPPSEVFNVFPPHDTTGEYEGFLPHIVLNRSTIPWERTAFNDNKNTPWLALVLLNESETNTSETVKAGDKIKLDSALLALENLADLVHVIQRTDGKEQAVLVGNRLPQIGKTSVVHLVAVDKTQFPNGEIPAGEQEFVSLFSWRFTATARQSADFDGDFSDLNSDLFQLPPSNNDLYNTYLKKGFTPLPHFLRSGGQTMSWYRSPFVPQPSINAPIFSHINNSDALLRYDVNSKMLDTTYAAAWELGRMLTFQEKDIAKAIYTWKRERAQHNKQNQEADLVTLLSAEILPASLPDTVKEWINNLLFLKPVPFSYLVPYEQMLPVESVRFFMLDSQWVQSLVDGALSIGRILDRKNPPTQRTEAVSLKWSGLLIRSKFVANYPDLAILVGNAAPIHTRRLANDMLLCIFETAEMTSVEFALKAEGMRFGFQKGNNGWQKRLKTVNGTGTDNLVEVPLKANNCVDFSILKTKMTGLLPFGLNAATLALQLMTSAPRVRLEREG